MIRYYFLTVIIISFLTFSLFAQNSEELTIEGTGIGVGHDEALIAAKRDAIEKGIGMVLLSQTETENFMVKRDMVISKTVGAVKEYTILTEKKMADGTVDMKIKATISRVAMKEDLAAFQVLIESMDKPRVMVLVSEDNVGTTEPTNQAAENAVITFLRTPYEFDCIDPSVAAQVKASKQKMAEIANDPATAAAIGVQNGAEVLITGTAISRKADNLSQNLGGMVSVQADVTLKAINCATGRIISTASEHAAKVHLSPNTAGTQAIAKASEKAAGKLLDLIIKDWQNQSNNGIPLSLTVKGVGAFGQKSSVLKTLRALSGVSAIRERDWNAQSAMLILDVQYKGNTEGFCTKADGKALEGAGKLSVTAVSGQQVTLNATFE
ncbi:MAG TPA: hypothetical protein VHO70_22340 [Chitinispirillaceae bacterium]|nr:hypothetical protein [Chitinispirillaceae bacterium]